MLGRNLLGVEARCLLPTTKRSSCDRKRGKPFCFHTGGTTSKQFVFLLIPLLQPFTFWVVGDLAEIVELAFDLFGPATRRMRGKGETGRGFFGFDGLEPAQLMVEWAMMTPLRQMGFGVFDTCPCLRAGVKFIP